MVKKYSDLYLDARRAFLPEDKEMAGNYARELLSAASGKTQEEIIACRDQYATDDVCARMMSYVSRRLQGEPLAYILEEWDFYGMRLYVNRDVLIPRDDTCAVTDLAIKKALFLDQDPRILDLCTGSGCIGLAVARKVKDARLTLADVSREALSVAKKNVTLQHLTGRAACVQLDVLQPAPAFLGTFHMIVSNPPYITTGELAGLERDVRDFEPRLALDGGPDGLRFYRAILDNFSGALQPEGFLCLEIGAGQCGAVQRLLEAHGYSIVEIKKDYQEIDRAILARKIREDA